MSIVITSFKEPKTIGKAIESILKQRIPDSELIVSAPDEETLKVASNYPEVKLFKDTGKGKTEALNLLLPTLKGKIIILTDGDVYTSKGSIKYLLEQFEDGGVGCVGGRPVPVEDKSTKWGFFANFLFDAAHQLRLERWKNNQFIEVSGYLFAFKNGLITNILEDVAEDTVIPLIIHRKGYKIGYAENAKVYVKNVDNWKDWLDQKIRTSKAHETLGKYFPDRPIMKGFSQEAKGITKVFSYPSNLKEFFWLIQLIIMRGYMWYKAKRGEKFRGDWKAVPSTK